MADKENLSKADELNRTKKDVAQEEEALMSNINYGNIGTTESSKQGLNRAEQSKQSLSRADASKLSLGRADASKSKQSFGRVEDEEESYYKPLRFINIIFLPYNPVFKTVILFCAIIKTAIAPIGAVYPFKSCPKLQEAHVIIECITLLLYVVDPLYLINTVLHIVHRQVESEAVKREHIPHSGVKIILDIISLIPLFDLLSNGCPLIQLWPNIACFSDICIIYQIVDYFSLLITHSPLKLAVGYLLMFAILINYLACFLLLLTFHGLCINCSKGIYDWRLFVEPRFPDVREGWNGYLFGGAYTLSVIINQMFDEIKPCTYVEFILLIFFMIAGNVMTVFVIVPKLFAEIMLKMRRIYDFHPRVIRVIEDTKRRNPSIAAFTSVDQFYSLSWKNRKGITAMPESIMYIPKYLRINITQNLCWAVFHHSPILRYTSESYKRWISEHVKLEYKLPEERFFTGAHCYTNLYYLKSGTVRFISSDDSVSPILSVTSGTILGDVNFFIPPLNRKVIVHCQTYCEMFVLTRKTILQSFAVFPEERFNIIKLVQQRIKHARTLYSHKENISGIDRSEKEGIDWLQKRWWEINDVITAFKHKSTRESSAKCEIPPEEAPYHCAKYIGQLVLCHDTRLQNKTLFVNFKFPWILVPKSSFGDIWHRIIVYTVYVVLLLYPVNLPRKHIPLWFKYFQYFVDFMYAADILVSIMTSMDKKENSTSKFGSLVIERFKSSRFIFDVASAIWLEDIADLIGLGQYYTLCQFNRLIKTYILFHNDNAEWNYKSSPLNVVIYMVILINFVFNYINCYFMFVMHRHLPDFYASFFFGEKVCPQNVKTDCSQDQKGHLMVFVEHIFEHTFPAVPTLTRTEIMFGMALAFIKFTLGEYLTTRLVANFYLYYREKVNYHNFVARLKDHYHHYKIHPDLMMRLERYLTCHWKYFNGMDIMHPRSLKDEPYDIYWKLHGSTAEKVIGGSSVFVGADTLLIRDLAEKARFTILPRTTTLFLFGVHCKNVAWIANGTIKCEYHDEAGELVKSYRRSNEMLSLSSTFLGNAALRTYTCVTECEILNIPRLDFLSIIKRYPTEWSYIQNCIDELGPEFRILFQAYVKKHKNYQKKLREKIFHARQSVSNVVNVMEPAGAESGETMELSVFSLSFLEDPESMFMQHWLIFRMITVVVSILCASLQVGSGAYLSWQLFVIGSFCNGVGVIDIALKLFLPYYDDRGLVISDIKKCMLHYMSRGLLMDLMGTLPMMDLLKLLMIGKFNDNIYYLVNVICKFGQLYLVLGYFSYFADVPRANYTYIMFLKWQITVILVTVGASTYFVGQCINFRWDDVGSLLSMTRNNQCWLPYFIALDPEPTAIQLHTVVASSLQLAQSGLTGVATGLIHIGRDRYDLAVIMIALGIFFWFTMCYCITLVVLEYRGDTLFQHGVDQLTTFLKAERVDSSIITHATDHFDYWLRRTKGLNMSALITERIGVIFREDLNFYFYKKTFAALDTVLRGGEPLQRQLCSVMVQVLFLDGYDIVREMDLVPWVYVVHRGKVLIKQNGKKLAILTKGAIFGALDSSLTRPVRITAVAMSKTDVLQIAVNEFHTTLTKNVRKNIANCPESAYDYMIMKKVVDESPYNTVQYLMRGDKTIKLPWMLNAVDATRNRCYYHWLQFVWLWLTVISVMLSLLLNLLPMEAKTVTLWLLRVIDTIFSMHIITDFYTMEIVVEGKKCVNRYLKWRKFLQFWFYMDIISVILPIAGTFAHMWNLHLMRLLRIHMLFDFHKHFCKYSTTKFRVILKFVIIFLILHAITCGWINFACKAYEDENFPMPKAPMPPYIYKTLDRNEWVLPDQRKGGCARVTKAGLSPDGNMMTWFVVAKNWQADYLISLSYIFTLHTHTDMDIVVPLNLVQIYYKVCITIVLYIAEIWLSSITISAMYTKYRELYHYDYNVATLLTYLRNSGLSKSLLSSVTKYTYLLWQRQKGNWLPEITQQASLCLQEDILSALYLYHLETPSMFRDLPNYFLRQLVVRLQRVVIFPGKYIVQEGDIWPCMYFIHDGDVEKWYTDSDGDNRLVSVLTINGFFGLVPGLFPAEPYQFSYYSRTVVDLIFLKHETWQDLLNGYPDIKVRLNVAAKKMKRANDKGKK